MGGKGCAPFLGRSVEPIAPDSPAFPLRRLFGEGLVAYMRVPDIIPAIAGVTMLPSGHAQNTICEFLIEELLKVSHCCP